MESSEAPRGRAVGGAMEIGQTKRAYSHYASVYDLLFDSILQPGRREAVRALDAQPGDRVLEIGVGTGLSVPFYPIHCHITGIDVSSPMLREAEKKRATDYPLHDLDLVEMDASNLEFKDGQFDRVLASYVLSTVPDPNSVLEEIIRICRPTGRVVIVNHFRSSIPPLALWERAMRPITWKLGFRLDLPLRNVTKHPQLEIEGVSRANLLGLWKLVVARVRPVEDPGNGDR